jgi:hypothetical protein
MLLSLVVAAVLLIFDPAFWGIVAGLLEEDDRRNVTRTSFHGGSLACRNIPCGRSIWALTGHGVQQ